MNFWKQRNSSLEPLINQKIPNHLVIQVKWLCMAKWFDFRFGNRGF